MKTSLILMLFCSFVFGQIKEIETSKFIEIGKASPGGLVGMTLKKMISADGELEKYIFSYKDYKYYRLNVWKEFEVNNDEDLEYLYNKIIEGLETLPDETIMLDLSNGSVIWLEFKKSMGSNWVRISSGDLRTEVIGFSNQFNKKQIQKLFGKFKNK